MYALIAAIAHRWHIHLAHVRMRPCSVRVQLRLGTAGVFTNGSLDIIDMLRVEFMGASDVHTLTLTRMHPQPHIHAYTHVHTMTVKTSSTCFAWSSSVRQIIHTATLTHAPDTRKCPPPTRR